MQEWTKLKLVILLMGALTLAIFMFVPMYLVHLQDTLRNVNNNNENPNYNSKNNPITITLGAGHVGLASLLHQSQEIQKNWKHILHHELEQELPLLFHHSPEQQHPLPVKTDPPPLISLENNYNPPLHSELNNMKNNTKKIEQQQFPVEFKDKLENLSGFASNLAHTLEKQVEKQDQIENATPFSAKPLNLKQEEIEASTHHFPLARGVAGLPMKQTPALIGAKRGQIQNCIVNDPESSDGGNVNDLEMSYWNDPVGTRDLQFQTPFERTTTHSEYSEYFLSFKPDMGGWNNIRMSFENMVVLAAATGRTLILPPKQPFYLLGVGEAGARSFGDFLSMTTLSSRIKMITMSDFLKQHAQSVLKVQEEKERQRLQPFGELCVLRPSSVYHCDNLYKYFRPVGWQPEFKVAHQCLIFDVHVFSGNATNNESIVQQQQREANVKRFCGTERNPVYYNDSWTRPQLIHWDLSDVDKFRILDHFYATFYFTNPVIDNYMKRLIRDSLHYKDEINCAAGKIVLALQKQFPVWSSWHVRHGDFQFKEARSSLEEWYNSTKPFLKPGEALYIATDENNRSFFEPLVAKYGHPVVFMDNFTKVAHLDQLDPTFLGMIETVVASYGRTFTGTWFSTFSGYINRLRGYRGLSTKNSWYSYLSRREWMQKWEYPHGNHFAREWPIAWVGIDGDELVEHELDVERTVSRLKKDAGLDSDESEIYDDGKNATEPIDRKVPIVTLSMLEQDIGWTEKPVARGVTGRPMDHTPAMLGAVRAHIDCDVNVDSLAYWNDPQGERDRSFKSPFSVSGTSDAGKYITFAVDRGGWNNIRMSIEIIFIIAFVTGRTLVLPPEIVLYLLNRDTSKHKTRSFADFFPLYTSEFGKRLKIISMSDFIAKGLIPLPPGKNATVIRDASFHCEERAISPRSCITLNSFLQTSSYSARFRAKDGCVVFDAHAYHGQPMDEASIASTNFFCGDKREITYWNQQDHASPPIIHFRADERDYRLLTHFYSMLHFTDPVMDNYVKRFVRDFLHYHDTIYCAAGKIVKALQYEGKHLIDSTSGDAKGHPSSVVDENDGSGGYSAMHIRRGDLQYKQVKLQAKTWWNNTRELWYPNEILYIATDERNMSWFNPLARHVTIRFLSDYWDLANLSSLDPNYMGMIDTIVASRGRAFCGTWFSTFSGYINRMRGYHGMSMMDSWYSFLPRKTALHNWTDIDHEVYAYEWPTGWAGIDADVFPTKEKY